MDHLSLKIRSSLQSIPYSSQVRLHFPFFLLCAFLCFPEQGAAQVYFGHDRARETITVVAGAGLLDFRFNGGVRPARPLEFDGEVAQIVYSRRNIKGSLAFGTQSAAPGDSSSFDLNALDFSIFGWSEVFLNKASSAADHRVFIPITLHSNFRKVNPQGRNVLEEFNFTSLGLGLGLGYYGNWTETVLVELRITPAAAVSFQTNGQATGWKRLIDTDLQVHMGPFWGRIGISLQYGYQAGIWNINLPQEFTGVTQDLFDYRDAAHMLGLGVNW